MSAAEVCDVLGRRNISLRVNRGLTAVSNAATEGMFPASWYLTIKAMCDAASIECPDRLFKFIPAEGSENAV